ncbi:MAG: hypothetical protein BRC41_19505 [Cyanobacteria bacterium QH_9_48_43]|nr:MAG: hypothetical protein BRC41_19505 [Cyanobacteria bacterium QH_9_48_43]
MTQIYLSVGEKEVRLTSVTEQDARLKEVDIATRADRIAQELRTGLRQAKRERQQDFLIAQAQQAAAVGTVMLLASLLVYLWGRRSKQSKQQLASSGDSLSNQPISTRLSQKQRLHLREVKHRLLQLAQAGIWLGGKLLHFQSISLHSRRPGVAPFYSRHSFTIRNRVPGNLCNYSLQLCTH